jgi:phosphotransferase system HPr (HPr) family protein
MNRVATAAITVTAKDGLDPELSALLVVKATNFKSIINLSCGERIANAKALIEVMSLGAQTGSLVNIQAQGEDSQQALNALIAVIQHYSP